MMMQKTWQKKYTPAVLAVLLVAATIAEATADFAAPSLSIRHRLLAPVIVGVRSARRSSGGSSRHHAFDNRTPPSVRYARDDDDEATPSHSSIAMARGGSSADDAGPPGWLKWAYAAAGVATTASWSTMVYTTIRSNQPMGAMMPSPQHAVFARMGAMAAAGLIGGSFASLATSASRATSWDELGANKSFRRHNLALATTGVASSLWVRYAELVTKIPGQNASHQCYDAVMQGRLIGCYGGAAALGAAVWARSLPEDVRRNPLSWPKRIVDGVSKSLLSIAPRDINNPVQVKYSLLTTSFLIFTALQTVCNMPVSVIPSWTSRRLSRAFPVYTFLGAVTCFDLKEATEEGRLLVDESCRRLSNGVKCFGGLYLGARAGAVAFDPAFPEHFGVVTQVPGLAVAAIAMVALTLRSDKE